MCSCVRVNARCTRVSDGLDVRVQVRVKQDSSKDVCDYGAPDPDLEVCDLEKEHMIKDDVFEESYIRGRWLLGLLVLQSSSSFVLDRYQDLLKEHIGT